MAGANLADSFFEIAKGTGDIIPGLAILVTTVQTIYNVHKDIKRQQEQCRTLAEFCQEVVAILYRNREAMSNEELNEAITRLQVVLDDILTSMQKWANVKLWDAWTKQGKIWESIQDKRVRLTDCFTLFGITSELQVQNWNSRFSQSQENDHALLLALTKQTQTLSDQVSQMTVRTPPIAPLQRPAIHPRDSMASEAMDSASAMKFLQLRMRIEPPGSDLYRSLAQSLLELQRSTGQLVPLADLDGEAKKIGDKAVHYSAAYEIWKGIWLGDHDELVALKCMRAPTPNENMVRRFHRQVEIVRKLRHKHIIPFYGACYVDGPSIYLVFPWMKHGDVMKYLETNRRADTVRLMLGVAYGLQHLHARNPPFIHGGLQPSNILVADTGDAVLSDFGLAKALEHLDAAYTNYTLSNGSQLALRWMAPELTEGRVGRPADIYSWGMTALQVLTGLLPFHAIKQPGRVVIDVAAGKRPRREDYLHGGAVGDEMWALLEDCWQQEPEARPTIDLVIDRVLNMRPDLRLKA